MSLKTKIDSLDGLNDVIKEHYTESEDGSFVLNLEGKFDHLEDVKRLKGSLENERTAHKATKAKYKPFSTLGLAPEELLSSLDELEEFKLKKNDNNDSNIDTKVAAMLEIKEKKWNRAKEDYETQIKSLSENVNSLSSEKVSRTMQDKVLEYAGDAITPKSGKLLMMLAKSELSYSEEGDSFCDKDGVPVSEWVDKKLMDYDMLVKPAGGAGAGGSGKKGKKEDNSPLGIIGRLK